MLRLDFDLGAIRGHRGPTVSGGIGEIPMLPEAFSHFEQITPCLGAACRQILRRLRV